MSQQRFSNFKRPPPPRGSTLPPPPGSGPPEAHPLSQRHVMSQDGKMLVRMFGVQFIQSKLLARKELNAFGKIAVLFLIFFALFGYDLHNFYKCMDRRHKIYRKAAQPLWDDQDPQECDQWAGQSGMRLTLGIYGEPWFFRWEWHSNLEWIWHDSIQGQRDCWGCEAPAHKWHSQRHLWQAWHIHYDLAVQRAEREHPYQYPLPLGGWRCWLVPNVLYHDLLRYW